MVPSPHPTATVTDWQIGVCCRVGDSVDHCLERLDLDRDALQQESKQLLEEVLEEEPNREP